MITTIYFKDGTSQDYATATEAAKAVWDGKYPKSINAFKTYLSGIRNNRNTRYCNKFKEHYNIERVDVEYVQRNIERTGRERPLVVSDNPYADLALAVITQAVSDYQLGNISTQTFKEFCFSEWFEMLANGRYDGEYLFTIVRDTRKKGFKNGGMEL